MNKTLIIAGCLISSLIFLTFLSWPKYQELRYLQEKIAAKKTELQYRNEHFVNLRNLSEELKKRSEDVAKMDTFLPADAFLPDILEYFQKGASQYGLIFKKISQPSSAVHKSQERIKEHQLKISLSGSYDSLRNFLSALEKTSRLIETSLISFSAPQKEGELFSFDLTLKFYSY